MARVPPDATATERVAFNAIWKALDKLGVSTGQNTDLRGRRVQNAGDARADRDLVTLGQLTETVDALKREIGSAGAATTSTPSTGTGGGGGGGGGGDFSQYDTHPDYSGYVQQAKDELVAALVDLTGPCGAFAIVKRAAALIQAVDATIGMFDKPGGTNCTGYSTDILCFVDGTKYDVLIGGGDGDGITTGNTPTWGYKNEAPEPDRYRPPI